MTDLDAQWQRALLDLIARSHLLAGDAIAPTLDEILAPLRLGAEVYLVDREQVEFRPLRPGAPLRVDGTLPGRAYQLGVALEGADAEGRRVLWIPLVDGVERLGLLQVRLPSEDPRADDPQLSERCTLISSVLAHLVMSKLRQSDLLVTAQRAQPMSVGSELLWQLLPPLTVGTESLALAAVLEPAYGVGGDAFDYAIGTSSAYFAIFDSSGHDLSAGLTASVALAAARTVPRASSGTSRAAALPDHSTRMSVASSRSSPPRCRRTAWVSLRSVSGAGSRSAAACSASSTSRSTPNSSPSASRASTTPSLCRSSRSPGSRSSSAGSAVCGASDANRPNGVRWGPSRVRTARPLRSSTGAGCPATR